MGSANTILWPTWGLPSPSIDWHYSTLHIPCWSQAFLLGRVHSVQASLPQCLGLGGLASDSWAYCFVQAWALQRRNGRNSDQLYTALLLSKHLLFYVSSQLILPEQRSAGTNFLLTPKTRGNSLIHISEEELVWHLVDRTVGMGCRRCGRVRVYTEHTELTVMPIQHVLCLPST